MVERQQGTNFYLNTVTTVASIILRVIASLASLYFFFWTNTRQ